MEFIAIFLLAFISEALVTGYTLSVARNKFMWAAICSGAIALMNAGVFVSIVDNRTLLLPSVLGEVVGTTVLLQVIARKTPRG